MNAVVTLLNINEHSYDMSLVVFEIVYHLIPLYA
jgi:hypothetical protein